MLRQNAKLGTGGHSLVDMHNKLGGCTVFASQDVATIVIDEYLAKSRFVATKKLADGQMTLVEDVQNNNGLIYKLPPLPPTPQAFD